MSKLSITVSLIVVLTVVLLSAYFSNSITVSAIEWQEDIQVTVYVGQVKESSRVATATLNPESGAWSNALGGYTTTLYGPHGFGVHARYLGVDYQVHTFTLNHVDTRPLTQNVYDSRTGKLETVFRKPELNSPTPKTLFTASQAFGGSSGEDLADIVRNGVKNQLPQNPVPPETPPKSPEIKPEPGVVSEPIKPAPEKEKNTDIEEENLDSNIPKKDQSIDVETEIFDVATSLKQRTKIGLELGDIDDESEGESLSSLKNTTFKRSNIECFSLEGTRLVGQPAFDDLDLTVYLMVLVDNQDLTNQC